MLLKTHLAFAALIVILFLSHINNKILFSLMVFVATVIPDLDGNSTSWGRHLIFRPLQFFTKHRGIIHSFSFAILISVVLAFYWPIASLGFFLGYSVHLLTDSFTKEGIQAFWPFKSRSSGLIVTGGRIEETLFFGLIFADFILFLLIIVF
jgi:membrane-bound metal-dependent hydrolase YbcI (DUF457 family)